MTVGIIAGAPGAASHLLVGGFTKGLPAPAEAVANQPGMFDAAKAKEVAATTIQAHPDLAYAFVADEEMAFAARRAFAAAGTKGVKIMSVNGTGPALAAVKDGCFSATVFNSANDTGELAVENTIACCAGGRASTRWPTPRSAWSPRTTRTRHRSTAPRAERRRAECRPPER